MASEPTDKTTPEPCEYEPDVRNLPELEDIEDIEVDLLIEAVYRRYGHDFRHYARASLTRRLCRAVDQEALDSLSALQARVLRSPACMTRLVDSISVNMTSMFRDPAFFTLFREAILPELRTYPQIRLWLAGCATGEEVYSVAIMLAEAGLYERARIYATDISELALDHARSGIVPLSAMQQHTRNYLATGGLSDFSSYYTVRHQDAFLQDDLKRHVVFAHHNLVTDSSFNEFHVILCRNVMIYFDPYLRNRVHTLLHGSLRRLGFLGLGSRESLRFSPIEALYEQLVPAEKWYRRAR
jgi:chemotaxis protein methyltransferase CheR